MVNLVILMSSLLPILSAAIPTSSPNLAIHSRSEFPYAKAIPSDCTITKPYPKSLPSGSGFGVSPTFSDATRLYTWGIALPQSDPEETLLEACMQTCYGYGHPGQCKAAFLVYNVPYVTSGKTTDAVVCEVFAAPLESGDFYAVEEKGWYANAKAVNIFCPPEKDMM